MLYVMMLFLDFSIPFQQDPATPDDAEVNEDGYRSQNYALDLLLFRQQNDMVEKGLV